MSDLKYLDNLRTQELIDEVKSRLSTVNTALASKLDKSAAPFTAGGSVAFADLPVASETNVGLVYNVTDDFTTTAAFLEGAGIEVSAGTDVAIVKVADSDPAEYKYNLFSGSAVSADVEVESITQAELIDMWKDEGSAQLDKETVSVAVNGTDNITVTGATGTISAASGDSEIATVSVGGTDNNVVTVNGVTAGNTDVTITIAGDSTYRAKSYTVTVTVTSE